MGFLLPGHYLKEMWRAYTDSPMAPPLCHLKMPKQVLLFLTPRPSLVLAVHQPSLARGQVSMIAQGAAKDFFKSVAL